MVWPACGGKAVLSGPPFPGYREGRGGYAGPGHRHPLPPATGIEPNWPRARRLDPASLDAVTTAGPTAGTPQSSGTNTGHRRTAEICRPPGVLPWACGKPSRTTPWPARSAIQIARSPLPTIVTPAHVPAPPVLRTGTPWSLRPEAGRLTAPTPCSRPAPGLPRPPRSPKPATPGAQIRFPDLGRANGKAIEAGGSTASPPDIVSVAPRPS